jgi:hypothetical protein
LQAGQGAKVAVSGVTVAPFDVFEGDAGFQTDFVRRIKGKVGEGFVPVFVNRPSPASRRFRKINRGNGRVSSPMKPVFIVWKRVGHGNIKSAGRNKAGKKLANEKKP